MDTLPDEMLLHLARSVGSVEDLTRLSMVCPRFHDIIDGDDCLWRDLHLRLYGPPMHAEFAKHGKTWRWLCLARRKPGKRRPISPANIELGTKGGLYYGDVYWNAGFFVTHGYGYWHLENKATLEGEWKRGSMHGAMKMTTTTTIATAQMASGMPILDTIDARERQTHDGSQWVKLPRHRGPYGDFHWWRRLFPCPDE
ncbi:F-box domain-containing protein [Acanthamoeba castellanii medusavirus]|uniref:F-box domain-containing protein n=1 Tax=Acanthamoeba castellanii medusavirus J1 TaxID=3114988 RepID=A0A3T1CWD3_9VIRU|nr:F-box domain-containing protein [Acanthamoeba castellanii medusavirus]BBI30146.1 F-box domain-containing protein [Acanthamoeba castellanii medusavirus J1]